MCKKEKTLYVTKLYNKRLYIRSVDNKDCLWRFASGHSPFLQSGVLFAAPQTLPHPLGNQRGAVTPTEPTGRKHPQLNVGTWLKLTWHGTSPTAPKGSLCRLRYPGQPCPGPAPWESIMVQCPLPTGQNLPSTSLQLRRFRDVQRVERCVYQPKITLNSPTSYHLPEK